MGRPARLGQHHLGLKRRRPCEGDAAHPRTARARTCTRLRMPMAPTASSLRSRCRSARPLCLGRRHPRLQFEPATPAAEFANAARRCRTGWLLQGDLAVVAAPAPHDYFNCATSPYILQSRQPSVRAWSWSPISAVPSRCWPSPAASTSGSQLLYALRQANGGREGQGPAADLSSSAWNHTTLARAARSIRRSPICRCSSPFPNQVDLVDNDPSPRFGDEVTDAISR